MFQSPESNPASHKSANPSSYERWGGRGQGGQQVCQGSKKTISQLAIQLFKQRFVMIFIPHAFPGLVPGTFPQSTYSPSDLCFCKILTKITFFFYHCSRTWKKPKLTGTLSFHVLWARTPRVPGLVPWYPFLP